MKFNHNESCIKDYIVKNVLKKIRSVSTIPTTTASELEWAATQTI